MMLKFKSGQEQQVLDALAKCEPDKEYVITIKRNRMQRSLPQNNYYHGVVVKTLALYIGDSEEAIHDMLKKKFNGHTIVFPSGNIELVGGSTAKLNTHEMTMYIEKIRNWAVTEEGCYIPQPNEITEEMYEKIKFEYENMLKN